MGARGGRAREAGVPLAAPGGADEHRSLLAAVRAESRRTVCDIGKYPRGRTPEGLDDMAGNVSEWTSSAYCPYDKPDCGVPARVVRGGGWCDDDPNASRTTTRQANDPTEASANIGFRCAADL